MAGIDGGTILDRIFSQKTEDDTGASYVDILEKRVLGREKSNCKCPKTCLSLEC